MFNQSFHFLRKNNQYTCRIKHLHVKTKAELEEALSVAQHEQVDCMVEIESSIDANANFHRFIG